MTNDQAKAYITIALANCGYKRRQIQAVLDELHYQFDHRTEDEAIERAKEMLDALQSAHN